VMVGYQRFERPCCLHLQGSPNPENHKLHVLAVLQDMTMLHNLKINKTRTDGGKNLDILQHLLRCINKNQPQIV